MAGYSGKLHTLLGRWLELVEMQKEAIQRRAPVETLQAIIGAKEELKEGIARILPGPGNKDSNFTPLLEQILEGEEQAQELLTGWLGELREEIARVHRGQEAMRAYFKAGSAPTAHFFDKRR
ncbi:MAG: flagellar protein FliT [Bacillota bacterium]